MQRLLYELQPDVLGQRASAQSIDVERIAVNLMDAAKTDNDGFSPEEELVCGFEEAAYFSNTLFRYGLFQNMELRLGGDAFLYQQQGANQGMKAAFSGLSIGTKIKCFDGEGTIPAVSVLADFSIPATASKGFAVDHLAPSLYLLFENPLNDKFSLGYNVGAEWDGTFPQPTAFVALCLGYSATERLGCFIESYNYFGALGNVYAMDLGLNWMVGKKVQLDLAANMDLTNPAQSWSISCGVAWQINK